MGYWNRSQVSRRTMLRATGAGVAGIAGAAVVGCGKDAGSNTPTTGTTPGGNRTAATTVTTAPRKGGTVRLGGTATNVDTADIDQSVSVQGQQAAQWVLDTLQGLDEPVPGQFKQVPQLAASLEQPDHLTYVYSLRKGVKWQNIAPVNGREFTADDAVFSLKRMATNDPRYTRRAWFDKVTAIEATDPYTLKLTTSEPVASLSYLIASPWVCMVAKEQAGQDGDKLTSYIGTGPYVVDKFQPGSTITYNRNPDYAGPGGYFDKVEIVQIADPSAWAAAFRAGEVSELSTIPGDTLASLQKQSPDAHRYRAPLSGVGVVAMNNRRKPFDDVRVRQAIACATDIPGWIQTIENGQGVMTGPIAPQFAQWGLPESRLKFHKQDPAKAKQLFAAAGVDPSSLSLKAMTIANLPSWVAAVTQFQADLKAIGVSVEINAVSNTDYVTRFFATHDFDVVVGGDFSADDPDQLKPKLTSGGSGNYSGYANPDLDKLLNQQSTIFDQTQRSQMVLQAQDIVENDVPTFYTYISWNNVLADSKLADWRVSAISGNQMRWNARNASFQS